MSSKRAMRRRGCLGKLAFASEWDAVAKREAELERGGDRLVPYRCPSCSAYHLGHRQERLRRNQKRIRRAEARWVNAARDLLPPPRPIQETRKDKAFNSLMGTCERSRP